jgi:hypothetical protein
MIFSNRFYTHLQATKPVIPTYMSIVGVTDTSLSINLNGQVRQTDRLFSGLYVDSDYRISDAWGNYVRGFQASRFMHSLVYNNGRGTYGSYDAVDMRMHSEIAERFRPKLYIAQEGYRFLRHIKFLGFYK